MRLKNVTHKVEFSQPLNDALPITKCVCGATFTIGQFVITTHRDAPAVCPACQRRLFWNANVRVYEVMK